MECEKRPLTFAERLAASTAAPTSTSPKPAEDTSKPSLQTEDNPKNPAQLSEKASADSNTENNQKKKKKKSRSKNHGKPVKTLVVDTNPFVKGLELAHLATKFITVPEVVTELRSKAAKERFEALDLKCGVELKAPDAESLRIVSNFAKKTGDFASLALADLKVIALAFMMEKKANGMHNLRLEPVGSQPNISDRQLLSNATNPLDDDNEGEDDSAVKDSQESVIEQADNEQQQQQGGETSDKLAGNATEPTINTTNQITDASAEDESVLKSVANDELEVGSDEDLSENSDWENGSEFNQGEGSGDEWEMAGPKRTRKVNKADGFFDGEWITPQNVKTHQAANAMGMKDAHKLSHEKPKGFLKVACVTSDFAMQNVLLKMGIKLVTPDGVGVKRLRTWVLRCHACFALTGDMNKQFCSSCGHPTLKRCSVTTGADGRLQIHLKKNYQYNLRGTKYSMPKPHGGRHKTHDIITREDDKAYMDAIRYKTRKEAKANSGLSGANSLLDPDYIPDLLVGNPLANSNGYGIATDARGMPLVARNRKNPNAVRRTGNRKHKKRDI